MDERRLTPSESRYLQKNEIGAWSLKGMESGASVFCPFGDNDCTCGLWCAAMAFVPGDNSSVDSVICMAMDCQQIGYYDRTPVEPGKTGITIEDGQVVGQ